jgi:putative ABC transport system permease protein
MLRHYLLLSLKVLVRRPFFTFISLFGISLTMLVLLTVTAVLDHALAPSAPETRQDRMLTGTHAELWGPSMITCCSPGFGLFDRHARDLPGAERVSLYSNTGVVTSYVNGARVESQLKRTDGEFWQILDFTVVEGRLYSSQEVADAAFVAVINRTTRSRLFGEEAAVGRFLEADGRRFRVVGVVEDVSVLRDVPFADIWIPHSTNPTNAYRTGLIGGYNAIVLASSPADVPHIREAFSARIAALTLPAGYTSIVAPLESRLDAFARDVIATAEPLRLGDRRNPAPQGTRLMATFAALGFLFVLLPAVNLVNINVSRIMERASEIGVRKAFGGSTTMLAAQFVTENVVLTLLGGIIGLLLTVAVLAAVNESGAVPYSQFTVSTRVFLAGQLMAIGFGVLSGAYPAWRMSRLQPVDALRGGERR